MDKNNLVLVESAEKSDAILGGDDNKPPSINCHLQNKNWNDWRWQLKNRITSRTEIEKYLTLFDEEKSAFDKINLPFAITPYYLQHLVKNNMHPLRKTVIPTRNEFILSVGESEDPLGEENQSPVECLVHRYPDRVLFLVTNFCSVNCRFCTRSRVVSDCNNKIKLNDWTGAIEYIKKNTMIRDVLISGGDPLTLLDNQIEWLLSEISGIKHVEMIRIGTKTPAVLPQRITKKLTKLLKQYHPLFLSLHFTHPDELTPETITACNMLADAGIPLGSQTVLMKDVNDSIDCLKSLYHGLLKARVKPYYLYQCDSIIGSSYFKTSIEHGLNIMRGLRGYTSGYAIPTYVIDAPNGGGKIPLLPNYVEELTNDYIKVKNYEGKSILCFS